MSCFAGLVSTPSPSGFADRGKGRGRVYENITETVGNTPCVKISDAICPKGRTIYVTWSFLAVSPTTSESNRCQHFASTSSTSQICPVYLSNLTKSNITYNLICFSKSHQIDQSVYPFFKNRGEVGVFQSFVQRKGSLGLCHHRGWWEDWQVKAWRYRHWSYQWQYWYCCGHVVRSKGLQMCHLFFLQKGWWL